MTDDIDKLSRRRRVTLATYGIIFLGMQYVLFARLNDPAATWRPVDWAVAVGFIGMTLTLIRVLTMGGRLFRGTSPETRAALDDELTRANRAVAYRIAYWVMLGVAFLLYVLSQIFELSPQECLKLVFAIGVAMPACTFAGLERKQGA